MPSLLELNARAQRAAEPLSPHAPIDKILLTLIDAIPDTEFLQHDSYRKWQEAMTIPKSPSRKETNDANVRIHVIQDYMNQQSLDPSSLTASHITAIADGIKDTQRLIPVSKLFRADAVYRHNVTLSMLELIGALGKVYKTARSEDAGQMNNEMRSAFQFISTQIQSVLTQVVGINEQDAQAAVSLIIKDDVAPYVYTNEALVDKCELMFKEKRLTQLALLDVTYPSEAKTQIGRKAIDTQRRRAEMLMHLKRGI